MNPTHGNHVSSAEVLTATVGPNLLPRTCIRSLPPLPPVSAVPVLSWRAAAVNTPLRRAEPRTRPVLRTGDVGLRPARVVRIEPGSPRWEAAFGLWSRLIAARKTRGEPFAVPPQAEPEVAEAAIPPVAEAVDPARAPDVSRGSASVCVTTAAVPPTEADVPVAEAAVREAVPWLPPPVRIAEDDPDSEWPYADELPYIDPRTAARRPRRPARRRSRTKGDEPNGERKPPDSWNRPRAPRPERAVCVALLEELASLRTVRLDERGRLTLKVKPGHEMQYLALRNRLLEIHRPFCAWVISHERIAGRCRTLTWDDHFQNAVFGMIRALDLFDPWRGAQFSTYAYAWIRQAVMRARDLFEGLIRVPKCTVGSARQAGVRLPAAKVECVGDGYRKLGPKVPARVEPYADGRAAEYREKILQALGSMPERQVRILRLRFGLEDGFPRTLSEVGDRFQVTRERVRQIEKKGLERLAILLGSNPFRYDERQFDRQGLNRLALRLQAGESKSHAGDPPHRTENGDGKSARAPRGKDAEGEREEVRMGEIEDVSEVETGGVRDLESENVRVDDGTNEAV